MSTPGQFTTGQTVLAVAIPEAEPVVGHWRQRYDPSTQFGVGAHVTVLFPFLPWESIDETILCQLTERFGAQDAFDVEFNHSERFPEWLYLAPEPDEGFRALTAAVTTC